MKTWLAVLSLLVACAAPSSAGGVNTSHSTPCVPLAPSPECPPTWAETITAGKDFCGSRGKTPGFSLSRSNAACGPWLRYSTYLFDAGPRNCLYDPTTEKLAGFGFFDGKANWQQRSCNVEQSEAVFPEDCAHLSCGDPAFGP
jgi:hypothetical protein